MKVLVSLQSFPLEKRKKETSLTPTCFPSFFSSHTQLLIPTPFLSALFKSKQKSHLVCLLAPSLSLSFSSLSLSLNNFFNCFYQSWGQRVTSGKIWLKKLCWRESYVTCFCCWSPEFHGYKLITKFRFSGKNVFKTSIFDLYLQYLEMSENHEPFLWMPPAVARGITTWLDLTWFISFLLLYH